MQQTSQRDTQSSVLYTVLDNHIPKKARTIKNKAKSWKYGYDKEYDMVIISKDGTVGEVWEMRGGLKVALPEAPDEVYQRSNRPEMQYWERFEYPSELARIPTIFKWNEKSSDFKNKWIDYIEGEFDKRENGFWFMNNGKKTYITGSNYMYVQWSKIDVGYPDYREANRILWIFWEACKADPRCYGICYVKNRRSGFSYMAVCEAENTGTLLKDGRIGMLSKTGADAKKLFRVKLVPINTNYPFFFKPVMDGMDKPKAELAFRVPATKITKRNMNDVGEEEDVEGLNTTIDWLPTDDNSYDGEKLQLLVHDEAGKWLKPNSIETNWGVTKTCLRLGRKIIGKCMMGSTVNPLKKGGAEFKRLYYDSDVNDRNKNGQTKSGLYSFFIPMEWNLEGYIDRYGFPVIDTPKEPVLGIDGTWIEDGAIDFWENEAEALKSKPHKYNEHFRQFPRNESHAFRDDAAESLFNLTKIYEQIDYNESHIDGQNLTRGNFQWKDGIKDTEVVFTPSNNGRFLISWVPDKALQNRWKVKGGVKYPANDHIGAFGCDSYDISGTVGGGGSNGALHGRTTFNMEGAPSSEFFLEYIARPQTAEIFYEDVLMACVFYGMPILIENNKPRLLYHFKNRGYRGFSLNRPDKPWAKLSKTEKELGGVPNSSEDMKQAHASAIETEVQENIGMKEDGEMHHMPFTRTLHDWAKFDISNRTKYDASISSGLAIMACKRHLYRPQKKESTISVNFARYRNTGNVSEIIR